MLQKYNNLVEEKKDLSIELKSSSKELENLRKKFDLLNEEYVFLKNEADEKITRQKTEIEKRIREQLVSGAPDEIQKLLEEHTSTLTQKYEAEMEETLQRLREVSLSLDKKKEELEQKENELKRKEKEEKALKQSHKDANEEINELKTALQGLVQPLKFINSLDTVFNDLNNIFSGIITAGVEKFEDDHKEKIKINLDKIESVFKDLKELFGVPLCGCQKDK
jgi:chromosome segregation ATPase